MLPTHSIKAMSLGNEIKVDITFVHQSSFTIWCSLVWVIASKIVFVFCLICHASAIKSARR